MRTSSQLEISSTIGFQELTYLSFIALGLIVWSTKARRHTRQKSWQESFVVLREIRGVKIERKWPFATILIESINLAWKFHWKGKKASKILVSDSIWVLTDLNFFKFLLYQIRSNCQTVKPWTFNFKTFFLDITKNFTVAFVIILLRSSFHALVVSCKYFLLLSKI